LRVRAKYARDIRLECHLPLRNDNSISWQLGWWPRLCKSQQQEGIQEISAVNMQALRRFIPI
jgi:hypothetical protein